MNNQSIFATPFVFMKYEDKKITFEMIGDDVKINDKPMEYMEYKEEEFKI